MEKSLFNQVGEVKGKVIDSVDSFSFQFTPQNENLKRTRGALFTLVTIHGKIENKHEKAKEFYHIFQSSYYAKVTGSIINGLSDTLDHVEKEFADKDPDIKYSLVAAVFWGAVLYLGKSGDNSVFVSRGGKLKKLDFKKVASGVLEDQDTVCLVTSKFDESIDKEDLAEILTKEKFQDVLETIDKKIETVDGAVCDVIRLSVNAPEQVNPISEIDNEQQEKKDVVENVAEEEEKHLEDQDIAKSDSEEASLPTEDLDEPKINEPVIEKEEHSEEFPRTAVALEEKSSPFEKLTQIKDNIWPKVSETGGKIFKTIAKPWKKPEPGEHVDHVAVKRAKLLQLIVISVTLLVVIIGFNLISRDSQKEDTRVASLITEINKDLEEAKNIKSIDPIRANTLLSDVKNGIAEAKKIDAENDQLKELESEAAKLSAEINRSYVYDKLETFLDFTKINKDAKITRLALNGTTLIASDEVNSKIYSADMDTQDLSEIEGEFSKPRNITGFVGGVYVQNEQTVSKIDNSNRVTKVANGTGWGEIVGAANYESNLYLLDKEKNEIWLYRSSSIGTGRPYIQGEKPDLSEATGITIDTYVWVVTKKGEIYEFARGKELEFSLSNMQEAFSNVVDIYTDEDAKNLYLLDQGKGRIVVVGKDGIYQAQYSNQELHQATSLVVIEEEKTAYVSVNGKVLSVALK